jgi:hypothetical protein
MSSILTSTPMIKMIENEPLAKLREGHSYWIRVVSDKRSREALFAVAAVRCENRQEIHWLSESVPNPTDAVRLMRAGFKTDPEVQGTALEVINKLISKGSATWVEGDAVCA